jgi:hypothetical protein
MTQPTLTITKTDMSLIQTLSDLGCIQGERTEWESSFRAYVKVWYVIYSQDKDYALNHGAWLSYSQIQKNFGWVVA